MLLEILKRFLPLSKYQLKSKLGTELNTNSQRDFRLQVIFSLLVPHNEVIVELVIHLSNPVSNYS